MIPKKIHIIWIGDESKRPNACIDSWKKNHPDYEVKVWGNAEYEELTWRNAKHMKAMWRWEICGVSDLMRWEILYNEGGFYVDADSTCIRPLDEWMRHCRTIACYENEELRPGLVATGFMGVVPRLAFADRIVERLRRNPFLVEIPFFPNRIRHPRAWKSVGPGAFTKALKREHLHATIMPSSFFLPRHYDSDIDNTHSKTYAKHFWGSTHGSY